MRTPSGHVAGNDAAHKPRTKKADWSVVWIDANEALIVEWKGGTAEIRRLTSDVPAHHRATGQVRHPGGCRPGGGPPGSAGEDRRQEHIRRFIDEVQRATSTANDLAVRGPGTMAQHLATAIRTADLHAGRTRQVVLSRSGPRTTRQLLAEVRTLDGDPPHRRTVGSRRPPAAKPKIAPAERKAPRELSEEF